MQCALGASVAVHALVFGVRLVDPNAFTPQWQDTPLEVVLVNARSKERPDKAQAVAQTSLAGGGEAELGRASSPLPTSLLNTTGDLREQTAATQVQHLEQQQNLLLARLKQQIADLSPRGPQNPANTPPTELAQREELRKQLSKQLAEIERRIQAENARPRKHFISPAVREVSYAVYYDALRHKIEDRGTENFPTLGGKKLYGELTMIITVNHDGQVLETEVVEGSGNPQLDRRAAAIARTAGPFGAFTPAMRKEFDQLAVVSRFKFTREQTLEAQTLDASASGRSSP